MFASRQRHRSSPEGSRIAFRDRSRSKSVSAIALLRDRALVQSGVINDDNQRRCRCRISCLTEVKHRPPDSSREVVIKREVEASQPFWFRSNTARTDRVARLIHIFPPGAAESAQVTVFGYRAFLLCHDARPTLNGTR